MSKLVRETIDGRPARVAHLDHIGGKFVDPKKAGVVLVVFDDGERQYLYPSKEKK